MSDREPSAHPTPPATFPAPSATVEPIHPPQPQPTKATTPDLSAPTSCNHVQPFAQADLEEESEVELVDWDEDDIDAAPVLGMEVSDDGFANPLTTEGAQLHACAAAVVTEATEQEHPRSGGDTLPSRTGTLEEARDRSASDVPRKSACAVTECPAASSTAPSTAKAATPPPPKPADSGSGAVEHAERGAPARLKSVLIRPASPPSEGHRDTAEDGQISPRWQTSKTKRRARHEAFPLRAATAKQEHTRRVAREAFKKRMVGRCYRCLASDHLLAHCREPVHCWECKGAGHFARVCPARRKLISAELRSRIVFPTDSIHNRIVFPSLTKNPPAISCSPNQPPPHPPPAISCSPNQPPPPNCSTPQSIAASQASHPPLRAMEHVPGQANQHPARGHVNIVPTEAIRLRMHAVVVSAPDDDGHCATATEVAHALWGQLRIPRHSIKVTRYRSGRFLAEFGSPDERDRAIAKGLVEEPQRSYRQAVLWGQKDHEPMARGRTMSRSPPKSGREHDILVHAAEEGERRHSRSPLNRWSGSSRSPQMEQQQRYLDPLVEEALASAPPQADWSFDPMIQESEGVGRQLGGCNSPDDGTGMVASPEYVPVHSEDEVPFGPGVQSPRHTQVDDIEDNVDTPMEAGMALDQVGIADGSMNAAANGEMMPTVEEEEIEDDGGQSDACAAFCRGIFKEAPAPLLPRPVTLPKKGGRGRKRLMVATRSSLRQAARPSPVPIAQRAQMKLMRELQFLESPVAPSDTAAMEYLDMYGHDLTDEAVGKIRAAARLGNKKLAEALAAVAAEMGAMEMEAI